MRADVTVGRPSRVMPAALAVILLASWLVPVPCRAELADGVLLGSGNWREAEGLLPPEILEHYRKGEYANRVVDLSLPGYETVAMPPDFLEASQANRGRFALTEAGTIVDAHTGTQPAFIMGYPFPDVDPRDPQAATKIVWNFFYNAWYLGDCHLETDLLMMNRRGIERFVRTDVRMRMYDGAPEARGRPNPENLLMQMFGRVTKPADLEGIISLTWRYRDPDRHDSLWTYVPGLRRARQVSVLNRSDGFMGSDLSLDDGSFFDGKPEDFTFRLVGRSEQLVMVDPYSMRGEGEVVPAPGGGWRLVWKDVPRFGADIPDWSGVPWAPVSTALARRPVWIVEARPRDPNYLYLRILLSFDAETYHGAYATKFDQANEPAISYQVSRGSYVRPPGFHTWVGRGGVVTRTAENLIFDRATVVAFPRGAPEMPSDFHVELAPGLFNLGTLTSLGK
jgi:hypothetical protein